MRTAEDRSLAALLDLDGEVMEVGGGFWVSIAARRVRPSAARPHGIDYSLCLVSPEGRRVICFDNAHSITIGTGPSKRRTTTRDHVHKHGKIGPYAYVDAESLLVDFWEAVYAHLGEEG